MSQKNQNLNQKEKRFISKTLQNGSKLTLSLKPADFNDVEFEKAFTLAQSALENSKILKTSKKKIDDYKWAEELGLIGRTPIMLDLFAMIDRIHASDVTVLITGENGTGKELITKAIHKRSKRNKNPFIATNCSAYNDNLLESEMFGHKRGSFTGAVSDKAGLFRQAHNGTLFLDEIGDMSPSLQVKLLRVLQEGTFTPVGSNKVEKVDVRIITATNQPLKEMVLDGRFREDLFYRINVVALHVPALRERKEDIPLLIQAFLKSFKKEYKIEKTISEEALLLLMAQDWPGNVRELRNEIERLWVLASGNVITAENIDLRRYRKFKRTQPSLHQVNFNQPLNPLMQSIEKEIIENILKQNNHDLKESSKQLGILPKELKEKLKRHQIVPQKKE